MKSTVSSGTGLYDISGLNAANYNMKVTAKGFQTYEQKGIVVNISAIFRVDVKLTIGTESQTVTVEANALAVQARLERGQHPDQRAADHRAGHQRPQRGFAGGSGSGRQWQPARHGKHRPP